MDKEPKHRTVRLNTGHLATLLIRPLVLCYCCFYGYYWSTATFSSDTITITLLLLLLGLPLLLLLQLFLLRLPLLLLLCTGRLECVRVFDGDYSTIIIDRKIKAIL